MNPSSEEFVKLREEILEHALPLLDSDSIAPEDRFRLSLQIAETKGSVDAYRQALKIADAMDGDGKLLAYLDLLGDIDYAMQDVASAQAPAEENSQAARSTEPINSESSEVDDVPQSQ